MAILINKSLCSGKVPSQLKIAKIIPLHKGKSKNIFNNFRPVSLLSSFSKIYERVVYKRLYKYCDSLNILNDSQYGFRSGRSTIDALSEMCGKIYKALDSNENVLSVNLDLSKAFDIIDHDLLLKKLEYYGIRGIALQWFKNYLNDRKMYVYFNNINSKVCDITMGVPQGSVLGPLLFNIYVNDVFSSVTSADLTLFADDSTLYKSGISTKLLFQDVNFDLKNIYKWFNINRLALNISKTNYLLFRKKNRTFQDEFKLKLGNIILERKKSTLLLGVHIDEFLSWDCHIKHLSCKLNSALYILNQLKHSISKYHLTLVYNSLFNSYLNYGCILWSNTKKSNLTLLKKLQVKAIKAINHGKNSTFVENNILSIDKLQIFNLCKFMQRFSLNMLPRNLNLLFTINSDIHHYRTRQSSVPHLYKHKCALMKNSFICQAPLRWISLPQPIKGKSSFLFSRSLKKYLLNNNPN